MDIPVVHTGAPGQPLPGPALDRAAARFDAAGVIVARNLFGPGLIGALAADYAAGYGRLTADSTGPHLHRVGDRRTMISLELSGGFADPALYAHPALRPLIATALGADVIVGSFVAVTSWPGAEAQDPHFDQDGLFGDPAHDETVPAWAVTLVVPLVALDATTGSTRFVPGSHRDATLTDALKTGDLPGEAPDLAVGDGLLFDSRILHGGEPNRSAAPRPILYITYHRAWYRDVTNHRDLPAFRVGAAGLDAVPAEHRRLFDWYPSG